MPSRRFSATAAIAGAVLVLSLSIPSLAEGVPRRFWGVVPQAWPSAQQLQVLKRGGADSIRFAVNWNQSSPGAAIDWSEADRKMEGAARAGIEALPFLYGAPSWAVRSRPVPGTHGGLRVPTHLPVAGHAGRDWAAFVRAAVQRYGPGGSFWNEHGNVPRRPVHVWQVWNEPNFKYFVARPRPREYGRLVKLTAHAIRAVDGHARIVLGGLFARPGEAGRFHPPRAYFAADFLARMLSGTPGVRSKFDGVALHPYAADFRRLPGIIEEVRTALRRHGAAVKGLWLTELGWSSERPSRSDSFAKGVRGQARQLKGAFALLRRHQRAWRLRRVYWFSVDDQPGICNFCGGSGLFGAGFRPKPAWHAFMRFAR
jgi:hypothetical protein